MSRKNTSALAIPLEKIRLLRSSLQYCRQYELDYSTDFIDLCFEYLAEIEGYLKAGDWEKALSLIPEFINEWGESSHTVLFKGILKTLQNDLQALKLSGNVVANPEPVKPVAQNLSTLKQSFSRICGSFAMLFDDAENGQQVLSLHQLLNLHNDANELAFLADLTWTQLQAKEVASHE